MSLQQELCEESEKTKRAREKLRKRLKHLEQKITQDALKRKIIEIHDRISRHAPNRISLTRKSIYLFDNNQHSQEESQRVKSVFEKIAKNNTMFLDPENNNCLKKYKISVE